MADSASVTLQSAAGGAGVMRDRFTGVIQARPAGRRIGFVSGNQQHPDTMCEVFILGPRVEDHEMPDPSGGSGLTAGPLEPGRVRPNRPGACVSPFTE
jgi:hypothetical protein